MSPSGGEEECVVCDQNAADDGGTKRPTMQRCGPGNYRIGGLVEHEGKGGMEAER